ncbi:cytochrome b [Alcaligenes phenolicus]|uniref:cytochrome b n=1 Tax=Alcaligenes phenolicus TaxID=232846 RepID=UPI002AA8FA2B|nr:cytochrome b [Alcaligenes phenolicus]
MSITPVPVNRQRYTRVACILHWLMALALTALVTVGYTMKTLPLSPLKLQVYSWHKWAGISLLVLVILRLLWRLFNRPPALPPGMSALSRALAHCGHAALYLLMIGIPLTGWLMSSAKGFQTVWFGVIPLPDLVSKDKPLGELLVQVHIFLNYALIAMVSLHILAALKHQFIDRDGLLGRITFTLGKAKS